MIMVVTVRESLIIQAKLQKGMSRAHGGKRGGNPKVGGVKEVVNKIVG